MKNYYSIPITSITIPSYFLKRVDENKQNRLKANIAKRGQVCVIHVRQLSEDQYELIAGRKIMQCLSELGFKKAVCYNHGKVSMEEAKLICVELGLQQYDIDTVELAQLTEDICSVYNSSELTESIPLSIDEIEIYRSYLTYDWDGLWNSFKQAQYEAKKKRDMKKAKEKLERKLTPSKKAEIQLERLIKGISRVA